MSPPGGSLATEWERTHRAHHTSVVDELARALRQARHRQRLSQRDVALLAGITVETYGLIERGHTPSGRDTNPTVDTLLRVALVLKLRLTITPDGDA